MPKAYDAQELERQRDIMAEITPAMLGKVDTEHAQQSAVFCWAARASRHYGVLRMLFAIPNGGKRGDGSERGAKIAGGRFKAEGVKSGVPDIFLPIVNTIVIKDLELKTLTPTLRYGLFIEMKREKFRTYKDGGRSEQQIAWGNALQQSGYEVVVCYGWLEAVEAICKYLNISKEAGL